MDKLLVSAAILCGLTSGIHIISGGSSVHTPILASVTDPELAVYVSTIWHAVTAVLIIFTAALARMSVRPNPMAELIVSSTLASFGTLFLYYGQTRLGTIWLTPQWTVFFIIPALVFWSHQRPRTRA